MNASIGNTVEQLLLRVSDLRDEQEKVLQRINEADLNNKKRLAAYDVQLKEMQTDLEKTKDEVKVLLSEKAARDKHDQERDRKMEELIRDKNYLRAQIDFLQSQMANVLTSALHSPTATHRNSPQALDSSDTSISDAKTDSRPPLPVQKTQSPLKFDSGAKGAGSSYGYTETNRQQRNKPGMESKRHSQSAVSQVQPRPPASNTKPNFPIQPKTEEQSTSSVSVTESLPSGDLVKKTSFSNAGAKTMQVVPEETKEYYGSQSVWIVEAEAEIQSASKTAVRHIVGAQTILLIDTSASMAENGAWGQATSFVNDYLNGLIQIETRYRTDPEYVSIVTYGSQTRCQQRFTIDYNLLKNVFASLKLGGPSPLYGGLLMAAAVANTPEKTKLRIANELVIDQKIILITDGFPTELRLCRGPDKPDPAQLDETTVALLGAVDQLHETDIDVFCVPVGISNLDLLQTLTSKELGRRILQFGDGHYFSRRFLLTTKLQRRLNFLMGMDYVIPDGDPDIEGRDEIHLQDIVDEVRVKLHHQRHRDDQNPYTENPRNKRLLTLGSRVRRGPDWGTDDLDGNGPGTVVGQHPYLDMLWVDWDITEKIQLYHYGHAGRYDVLAVDEPRIPLPGQPLEIGCVVQTGKDWKDGDIPESMEGVILNIGKNKQGILKALVRWENGKRGWYSTGVDRVFEIQICLPVAEAGTRSYVMRSIESKPTVTELSPPQQKGATKALVPEADLAHLPSPMKTNLTRPPTPVKQKNKNKNS